MAGSLSLSLISRPVRGKDGASGARAKGSGCAGEAVPRAGGGYDDSSPATTDKSSQDGCAWPI